MHQNFDTPSFKYLIINAYEIDTVLRSKRYRFTL